MKKLLFFSTVLFLGFTGISNAQIQEGNLMLGSDIGSGIVNTGSNGLFGFNFGLNDGAGFNVGISPKIGYFVSDNFLLGGVVNLGFTKSPENNGVSTKTTTYGVQALSRYYLSPGERGVDNLLKHGRFFMEANAGIAGVNIKDGPTTNGFAFGVGPGYSYFLTESVALEASAKYNGLVGGGNTTYQHSLGLNFGVQIFLPASKTDNMRDENM
ncbi:hypothetical protein SAMN05444483_1158 [Salegentibacter echinorum]|uniref:Outer membrane protein beta-barrel domain-containing protein n=1 Tax=Salegentibacter echinorum TaxID=1073325 RepID=A0A1M5KID3_SALEC|nr:hypothetical protein [Salegentibacter echinorum]SHG52634.1 hypothetical protein SAMN05444483_1158 [Salegentibacter echinorum]